MGQRVTIPALFFLGCRSRLWILAGWNCTICQILTRLDRPCCFDQFVSKVVNISRVLVACSVPLTAVNICEFDVKFYIVLSCYIRNFLMLNGMMLKHLVPN